VITVELPPLSARRGDVPLLVRYYIDRFCLEFGKSGCEVSAEVLQLLEAYGWPGNVRELRNVMERAVLLSDRPQLAVSDFLGLTAQDSTGDRIQLPPGGIDFEQLERDLVEQALVRAGGNQTRAAQLLGMNRDQIRYRIDKFGIK
jgi:two-component system NtrC family response regulator